MKTWYTTLAGFVAGLLAGAVLAAQPADAQVAFIDGPNHEVIKHNTISFRSHIPGTNWTFIRLRDGSEWTFTPCRTEDSRNCWWNAHRRGNHEGRSFVNLNGARLYCTRDTEVGR